jgi:hypothetical protein
MGRIDPEFVMEADLYLATHPEMRLADYHENVDASHDRTKRILTEEDDNG